MNLVLLRYGEVALKGRNRHVLLRRLRRNVRACLSENAIEGVVRSVGQRIYVHTDAPHAALEPLSRVFGLVSVSPAVAVPRDLAAITAEALRQAEEADLGPGRTFRIQARRASKSFPLNSRELNQDVGAAVLQRSGAAVDLSPQADLTIGIEIADEMALVYHRVIPAPGGLPLGVEGRVVALISGGIDSPVAAWLMMKRGCSVIPLHLSQDEIETQKALDNIEQLRRYSYGWQLRPTILSHAEVIEPALSELQRLGEERWSCLLCKRAMLRKACELAGMLRAHAIVMGDSLGQVASQTLSNMEVISFGMPMPILRPLIGMDKTEIVDLARRIGTFDTSTRSSAPCRYVPLHPLTHASIAELQRIEAALCGAPEAL